MKAHYEKLVWIGIVSLIVLVLVAAAGYYLSPTSQAQASPDNLTALTNGQIVAIHGAEELLLLSPSTNWSFLPLVER